MLKKIRRLVLNLSCFSPSISHFFQGALKFAETWPLCTGVELNLRNRVWGEVENSFIALLGKGGHSGLMHSKLCVPTSGDLVRSFTAMVQGNGC